MTIGLAKRGSPQKSPQKRRSPTTTDQASPSNKEAPENSSPLKKIYIKTPTVSDSFVDPKNPAIATAAKPQKAHVSATNMRMQDGGLYTGHIKSNVPHGKGIQIYPNGTTYEGRFQNGSRHGQGTLKFKDGTTYEGGFQNGKLHGQGTLKFKDGTVYVGQFQDGKFHGNGKMTYPDGPELNCRFERDMPALSEYEQSLHLYSTLFASLLAGTNEIGSHAPYSLQVLSKYLLHRLDPDLRAAGRDLQCTAEISFLAPIEAQQKVIEGLNANRNVLIPFGFTIHAMLLDLRVTAAGIEARIYNSGEGLSKHHKQLEIDGKTKYQTCKTVLFEGMTPDTPAFETLLSKLIQAPETCTSAMEAYALFKGSTSPPDSNVYQYQSPQKSGNCELECIMAALLGRLGRARYDWFRLGLITAVRDGYREDRQDYTKGSTIRKKTMARLLEMDNNRLSKII